MLRCCSSTCTFSNLLKKNKTNVIHFILYSTVSLSHSQLITFAMLSCLCNTKVVNKSFLYLFSNVQRKQAHVTHQTRSYSRITRTEQIYICVKTCNCWNLTFSFGVFSYLFCFVWFFLKKIQEAENSFYKNSGGKYFKGKYSRNSGNK